MNVRTSDTATMAESRDEKAASGKITPGVPFNWPAPIGRELDYIADAAARGNLSGDGHYSRLASEMLSREHDNATVLLTTSCTHALEMTALLLDIQPGDEVIVPSFTFVSAVNAFALRGAKPVFADIRLDTMNIDEARLDGLITSRTRAVVPVHYAGIACEMRAINSLCERYNLALIEDNAHGLFGGYNGRALGTFGGMSTLSFHETKNFTSGQGGALVINDPAFLPRAEVIRENGTNRSAYFRGQVAKYSWMDLGSSYLPSELLAAWLFAQLEEKEKIMKRRAAIWNRYAAGLAGWASKNDCSIPFIPYGVNPSHHIFFLVLPSLEYRTALIDFLHGRGIASAFHYQALNLSSVGRKYGGRVGECPVAEAMSDRLIRLPLFNTMELAVVDRVIQAIESFTF